MTVMTLMIKDVKLVVKEFIPNGSAHLEILLTPQYALQNAEMDLSLTLSIVMTETQVMHRNATQLAQEKFQVGTVREVIQVVLQPV